MLLNKFQFTLLKYVKNKTPNLDKTLITFLQHLPSEMLDKHNKNLVMFRRKTAFL